MVPEPKVCINALPKPKAIVKLFKQQFKKTKELKRVSTSRNNDVTFLTNLKLLKGRQTQLCDKNGQIITTGQVFNNPLLKRIEL